MAREDKGRIRFILVDVEASNDTLQDALRTVAGALARPGNGAKQVKALPVGKGKLKGGVDDAPADEGDAPLFDPVDEAETEDGDDTTPDRPKTQRKVITPKVLTDVDLKAGDTPFRTFVEQKQPQNQFDKYLAVAAWFKQFRGTDTIAPSHIYTCYRFMDGAWAMPKEFGQPFRDMKTKGWFDNGDSRNSWKITHIGEDKVSRMAAGGAAS